MSLAREAGELIRSLESNHFCAECPCCGEQISLDKTGLFYLDSFSPKAEELYQKKLEEIKSRKRELKELRKSISKTSNVGAVATNLGKILERVAPCMEAFPFNRNDCRSLFDPIDYIIFEGLSKDGLVNKIVFTDIKTGTATLKTKQKEIRKLVEQKHVVWDTYQRK